MVPDPFYDAIDECLQRKEDDAKKMSGKEFADSTRDVLAATARVLVLGDNKVNAPALLTALYTEQVPVVERVALNVVARAKIGMQLHHDMIIKYKPLFSTVLSGMYNILAQVYNEYIEGAPQQEDIDRLSNTSDANVSGVFNTVMNFYGGALKSTERTLSYLEETIEELDDFKGGGGGNGPVNLEDALKGYV